MIQLTVIAESIQGAQFCHAKIPNGNYAMIWYGKVVAILLKNGAEYRNIAAMQNPNTLRLVDMASATIRVHDEIVSDSPPLMCDELTWVSALELAASNVFRPTLPQGIVVEGILQES